jgi:hypothetical protein
MASSFPWTAVSAPSAGYRKGFPFEPIVATGESGKADRTVTRVRLQYGPELLNVDRLPPREPLFPYLDADLAELDQTVVIFTGAGAVVYLGAILIPGHRFAGETFRNNTLIPYTVQRGHLAG